MDTIQELRAFDQLIWEKVQEYLNDRDCYSSDVVIAINSDTYEVVIDSPTNLSKDFEQYPIDTLIRKDEQGNLEPDCDATDEIANQYYFVR